MKDSISDVKIAGYEQFTGEGNTTAVDRLGFEGVLFAGTVSTSDTVTLKLEEADTLGGAYTDVAADQMYGDTGVVAADANFKIGYTGYKQFVRLADSAGTAVVDSVAILRHPAHQAQA